MRATTVRLPENIQRQAHELARREEKELAPFLRELIAEGIKMRRVPGIVFVGRPPFRAAMVAGTGLAVWEFVSLYRAYDQDATRLFEDFPRLQPHHVQTALAYLRAYPDEVEEKIRRNERPIEEWMKELPLIRRVEVSLQR